MKDWVSGEEVTYTYDALQRLASALTTDDPTVPQWGQSYSYDGFGNLTDETLTKGTGPDYHVIVNPANNQISGGSYDANGNDTSVGSYNVANQLVQAGAVKYGYDPDGKRVWKSPDGVAADEEFYFWAPNGQRLGTYKSTNPGYDGFTTVSTNLYFGGRLIQAQGTAILTDRLGSNVTGGKRYYPYGQEKPSATANEIEKFGGYFRDTETGCDYADHRYYAPGTARFTTVDPSGGSWNPANPLSWNSYTYVADDPVNSTDPTGLDTVPIPGTITTGPGNCSTVFIQYAADLFNENIYQFFNSDQGVLAVMGFFEQQGSGSTSDQGVWAALDWTFENRWHLSPEEDQWFYGPSSTPPTFEATVMQGSGVFSYDGAGGGQLKPGFDSVLFSILTGPTGSSQCSGLARAVDTAYGVMYGYIPDPVPGSLQFASNGAVPSHSSLVKQSPLTTLRDGPNTWTFFSDRYDPPPVKQPHSPGRRR